MTCAMIFMHQMKSRFVEASYYSVSMYDVPILLLFLIVSDSEFAHAVPQHSFCEI